MGGSSGIVPPRRVVAFDESHIPLDKSWLIRMTVMDLLYGDPNEVRPRLRKLLDGVPLSDDIQMARRLVDDWEKPEWNVGESGTLYRFLTFINWRLGYQKRIVKTGTLAHRQINNNPKIADFPQSELLRLDNHTSQWASAAVICGNKERLSDPPYKLQLTYEAVDHWWKAQKEKKPWELRQDATISEQAKTFVHMKNGGMVIFRPRHSEDYCFARAFGLIEELTAAKQWPSLRTHETDRIEEMSKGMRSLTRTGTIGSLDHRVVQALVMFAELRQIPYIVTHPKAVNKSWPQFWAFINSTS
jgi:hypothetical protein